MRYSLILLVVAMLLSLGVRYLADPARVAMVSSDPAHDLQELCQRDPLLGPALDQADRGDVSELAKWINRAEPPERQRLAMLLFRLVEKPGAADHAPDPAQCWTYRHRFRAFLNLGTGNEVLDQELDNLVAYTLVTGAEKPTPQELALARSLIPRLARVARELRDDAIMDTIGCVQFAAEDFAAAKESFTLAGSYAKEKRHVEHDPLYSRRLDAADGNARLKAEGQTADFAPLPLEDGPAPPTEVKTEVRKP